MTVTPCPFICGPLSAVDIKPSKKVSNICPCLCCNKEVKGSLSIIWDISTDDVYNQDVPTSVIEERHLDFYPICSGCLAKVKTVYKGA